MTMYQHILLATDFTEHSKVTADKALQLAEQFGAQMSLIHVVESLPSYASGYLGAVDIEQELFDEAKKNIAELGRVLAVAEDKQIIEVGSPKAKILHVAEDIGADLIITGSHGRHGVGKLLGSTASSIVHGAKCDVLTVKCPE
ncbi:MAG: universal stress protein A [Legionellales bacterium]|nr:universal stress protein A [Legionellales bacterium]|tara:strand:- start:91547 stop:91975 length:429 start_codon:yes stop_codon:yes gene_type:complete